MSQICPVCQTPIEEGVLACPACSFRLSGTTQKFSPVSRRPVDTHDAPELETKAVLRMVRGPQIGAEYPLEADRITIGRNPQSDIFLNDMTVSREHAEIVRQADVLIINDMHSFNGVWVNNRTVEAHALRPADYIQIGKYDFVYEEKPAE